MDADRLRSRLFFALYALALLFGLAWVNFGYVRANVGASQPMVYAFFAAAMVYVGLRAFLVLRGLVTDKWDNAWLAIDLAIITAAVYHTGGLGSDAAMLYCWPLITASIQRRPRTSACLGVAILVAYGGVALAAGPVDLGKLATHLVIVVIASSVATFYSLTEASTVEENTRLRERLAVADYRSELSREMHDTVLQRLSRIATRLEMARVASRTDPDQALRIATNERLTARQAADELRYVVRCLNSPELERKGLLGALPDHIAMFGERSGVETELTVEGDAGSLAPDLEKALFRIVQEALTNVEKYAEAGQVRVELTVGADALRCMVADDGAGFSEGDVPEEPGLEGGFGILSMRERAEAVGGEVTVESSPGEGTTVTFSAPVSSP